MMRRLSLAIAAAAALLVPVAAPAQVVRQFTRKDLTIQVEPNLAYIFYRTQAQVPMIFIREPNASDWAVWRGARSAALDKALKKYQKEYRSWQSAAKQWDNTAENMRGGVSRPVKPVMPTDDNFAFPTIEMSTMTEGRISPAFFKEKPVFGFLIAVPPGTYMIYGSVMAFGGNMVGVCMCMGTVKFEARAGEIVDLGIFAVPGVPVGTRPAPVPAYSKPPQTEIRPFDGPPPARFAGLTVRPAEYYAAGKLPNYFGVTIDRLAPMQGVLGYRRDRIIDQRTGQPITNQSGTAEGR